MRLVRFHASTAIAIASAAFALGTPPYPVRAAEDVAYVYKTVGTWSDGSKTLAVGDPIAGGATLVGAATNPPSAYIRLMLSGSLHANDPTSIVTCYASERCARGLTIPAISVDGPLQRLQEIVFAIFTKERYPSNGATRGVSEEELRDGVVALDGTHLVLGATASAIDDGNYVLILTRSVSDASPAPLRQSAVVPFTVDGKHAAATTVATWPNGAPGLYHVHLERTSDPGYALGEDAVLLVAGPARYAALSADYARMVAAARPADANAPAGDDARPFLRATLEALERSM